MADRAGSAVLGKRLLRALCGIPGGTLGYPPGFGRPSESRYEADLDAERPAAGQSGMVRLRLAIIPPVRKTVPPHRGLHLAQVAALMISS